MRPTRIPPPRPRQRNTRPLRRHARRHPLRRGRTSPRPPHDILRQPRHGKDGRGPPPRQGVPRARHTPKAQVPRGRTDGPHRRRSARHGRQDPRGAGGGTGRHPLRGRGVHARHDVQAIPRGERGERCHERGHAQHRHGRGGTGLAAGHTRRLPHRNEPLPGASRRAATTVRRHVRIPGLHLRRARRDLRGPRPRQGILPRRDHTRGLHIQAVGEADGRALAQRA
mmetsp:Transcript_31635/g.76583  ORF Transcript_31635/g.76583 Transcript_31635/m.76583 type:complete len:225 (-) Transcript_31635:310-984(-)